jgi:protein required for attachment to host cells
MRNPRILYVLLDGGRARFVHRDENGHFAAFETHESDTVHDKSHEMGRDKPARVQESASSRRSASEPRSDPHDKAEAAFVDRMLARVPTLVEEGRFDLLFVAAPASLHAPIRHSLPPPLAAKLKALLGKDLTRIPDGELKDHLQ